MFYWIIFRASIIKSLEEGEIIFCDRYYFSGAAYSSAAWGIDREWCFKVEEGLLKPDHVLFFHVTPEVAAARGGYGVERYEKQDIQNRVRKEFEIMGEAEKANNCWTIIDACGSFEDVQNLAITEVNNILSHLKAEYSFI